MPKRIYVGNLPFSASDEEVRNVVGRFGPVRSLKIERGAKASLAVVEMNSGVERAIQGLRGLLFKGSRLEVNEARPRT